MNKMMKCILSVLVICAIALSATACGSKQTKEENATKITFYIRAFEDWSQEYTTKKVEQFNKILDDGIEVELRFYDATEYGQLLTTAYENNTMPDVYLVDTGAMYNYYSQGYIAPINDYFTDEEIADINSNADSYLLYDGKYYGYPWMSEPNSIFIYRKDYLTKAGVSIPDNNIWTWNDLLNACSKIKPVLSKGQYVLGMPLGIEANTGLAGLAYSTTGGDVLNNDWTECLVQDNEGWRNFYGLVFDLYKGGYCPMANVSTMYNDIIDALCENKLAMTFCGSWSIAEVLNNYPEQEDNIGVAVIPTKDGDINKTTTVNGGWNYVISSKSAHKDLAAQFIKFMLCNKEVAAEYFELANYCKAPVLNSLSDYIETNNNTQHEEWMQVVEKVTETAITTGSYSQAILSAAYGTAIEYIMLNTDKNKDDVITKAISDAKYTIETIIGSDGWTRNPKA